MVDSVAARPAHLQRLTDARGLLRAAMGDCPDRSRGYRTVDNADALRLCAFGSDRVDAETFHKMSRVYFGFLMRARRDDGSFRHACDAAGRWVDDEIDEVVQSRVARALATMVTSELPIGLRLSAASWWQPLLSRASSTRNPVAAGNWLIALACLRSADPGRDLGRAEALAEYLLEDCLYVIRSSGWEWFEAQWSPGAASIPAGLWSAHRMLRRRRYAAAAKTTTEFLLQHMFGDGVLVPVGTDGGWRRGGYRALFDQLPEEVAGLVELFRTAEKITGDERLGLAARRASEWFTGRNVLRQTLVSSDTGGCSDALRPGGPDRNQSAAAVLAWLLTHAAMTTNVPHPEDAPEFAGGMLA